MAGRFYAYVDPDHLGYVVMAVKTGDKIAACRVPAQVARQVAANLCELADQAQAASQAGKTPDGKLH